MANVWNKIDSGLGQIYVNFLRVRDQGAATVRPLPVVAEGGPLFVLIQYQGSLEPVQAAGFRTIATDGRGTASGTIRLEDLEAIADCPEVRTIQTGSAHQPDLETSHKQVRAHEVWSLTPQWSFTGNAGAGALVGIIDTGVDIHHPYLWLQSQPTRRTRIRRLWDMGLVKVGAETSPAAALLDPLSPGTYGVEYTDAQIDAVIQGIGAAMPIRSKDCIGHGTHVASIAAGDGRFRFKNVGVAPRAELIVVKISSFVTEPRVGPITVTPIQKFRDAVMYIRNVAAALGKPVVINYSMGNSLGPHDGLTQQEDWLADVFKDANSAGKVFVTAAGNSAGGRGQHTRVTFTAANQTIEVPFTLYDNRVAFTDSDKCVVADNTQTLYIEFYYPDGPVTIEPALKPQGEANFTNGPAVNAPDVAGVFSTRSFTIVHGVREDVLFAGSVRRRFVRIVLPAHPINRFLAGEYVVRLKASVPAIVHAFCLQTSRKHGVRLRLMPPPLPAGVAPDETGLIGAVGGAANIVTVAAYKKFAPFDLAPFSSRGPLLRHGAGGPPLPKPDLGAPGFEIYAAESQHAQPNEPGDFVPKNGTSMAAPHVAGAVALILAKNMNLTPSAVLALLQANALKIPPPIPDEIGGGRLDVKASVTAAPAP